MGNEGPSDVLAALSAQQPQTPQHYPQPMRPGAVARGKSGPLSLAQALLDPDCSGLDTSGAGHTSCIRLLFDTGQIHPVKSFPFCSE